MGSRTTFQLDPFLFCVLWTPRSVEVQFGSDSFLFQGNQKLFRCCLCDEGPFHSQHLVTKHLHEKHQVEAADNWQDIRQPIESELLAMARECYQQLPEAVDMLSREGGREELEQMHRFYVERRKKRSKEWKKNRKDKWRKQKAEREQRRTQQQQTAAWDWGLP